MADETTPNPEPQEEGLMEKARKLANQAEDFFEDAAEKVKQSETFKKATDFLDKAEDFVEDKTKDIVADAKVAGKNLAEKVGDIANKVADRLSDTPKAEETPPPASPPPPDPAPKPEEPKV